MKIRLASLHDSGTIVKFNSAMAIETESLNLNIDVLKKGVEQILLDSTKGFYIVAEIDNIVVGQLMITYEWSDWRCGNFWWIQSVYVLPEHRQSGVFKSLYQFIYDTACKDKNVCGIRLYTDRNNLTAKETYLRLGMAQSHYEMFETEFKR